MWLLLIVNFAAKIAAFILGWSSPFAALALWFVPDALVAYHVFVTRAQGLVRTHRRFVTGNREVWLTIDDGPDPDDTPRILKLLATHGARATFFLIGENAARHPDLVRTIVEAGHEVAHHTQTHPLLTFWCASPSRVGRELDECLAALRAVGVTPTRFRPPAGLKNLWLGRALARRGLVCVGWSVRGLETRQDNPEAVAARLMRNLTPGAILLTHEGPSVPASIRVDAIRLLLEHLFEQDYRCVVPEPHQLGR